MNQEQIITEVEKLALNYPTASVDVVGFAKLLSEDFASFPQKVFAKVLKAAMLKSPSFFPGIGLVWEAAIELVVPGLDDFVQYTAFPPREYNPHIASPRELEIVDKERIKLKTRKKILEKITSNANPWAAFVKLPEGKKKILGIDEKREVFLMKLGEARDGILQISNDSRKQL